ncbi:MAG: TRAP transporter substrate-binding protein [Pseudomonadota bacterium]|nr:TRAP transporter substrate-binding protein [Pseudomonadota bacterium]
MTKFSNVVLAAAALGLVSVSFAAPVQSAERNLKLAYFGSPKSSLYKNAMVPWMVEMNKLLTGKIKVDGFPGGTMGRNPRAQVKLVQDGVVDIGFFVPSYTPGRFPDTEVMELPGIFRNSREASVSFWRLYDKGLQRGFEKFHVFSLFTTDAYNIHTKKPIKRLSELKGLKLRAGGPVAAATLKAVGAVPVGMPITTVAENISKGVLDGSASDWNVAFAFRIIDIAKHHYMALMGTVPIGMLMTKKNWNGLSSDVKAAFIKTGGEAFARRHADSNAAANAKFLSIAKSRPDNTFVIPGQAEQKAWESATQPVIDNWIKKHPNGRKLYNTLQQELTKIRTES